MTKQDMHTPGPWQMGRHENIVAVADGRPIANTKGYFSTINADGVVAENEANARRIVACVNACAGIETETLEKTEFQELMNACAAADRFVIKEYNRANEATKRADDAVRLLQSIKWKSAEKDNMEFSAKITCYQMDDIRALLEEQS